MMVTDRAKPGEALSPELVVVIPVYNEQPSLRKVIREWYLEIENWTEDFLILVMNDGSTDRSPDIVGRLQEQLGDRIRLHTHTNRGHGLTCLAGYERALAMGARYVFQIDSDGQCDPQYFFRVWRLRERFQVVYGWRKTRDDGWRRVLASRLLRMVVLATAGVWCVDANTPYRLMHASVLTEPVARLKATRVDLTNIGLAVLLKKMSVTHGTVPIRFRERYGGEPSVRLGQFGAKAVELVRQLRGMM
jgi:dolichol-phosphate mannosyltransferase